MPVKPIAIIKSVHVILEDEDNICIKLTYSPNSLPIPDAFFPPKGAWTFIYHATISFMQDSSNAQY